MMKLKRPFLNLVVILAVGLSASWCWSAGEGIKERMKQRLPEIVQMKADGLIGENAAGYLEFVAGKTGSQAVVDQENADRKTVYSAIAAQQGVGVEQVERQRALQIVEKALVGEYLKNETGVWYQK